ncbi:uncharacterized protein LOC110024036 [Phalaenopsis equestris]|uniref:uncharacterized protein LOC110024036 n=1 Tax=Phalaenopsis equestris TaxID=78828 RepID=UPI0009E3C04F|nr:uncharacterized protein LOC110024036 [Phalaenopsis equestris]
MECEEDHRLLEVAKALLLLRASLPPDRPPASTKRPFRKHRLPPVVKPVMNTKNASSVFLPTWGVRQKRSSNRVKSKRKRMEGPQCLGAVDASRVHRSPDTPLDLGRGFDPSTSGRDWLPASSEIPPCKRFRACETTAPQGFGSHIKVSKVEPPSMVEDRPAQPMKRQGRKKTKSELQAEERFFLEDNQRLTKILELEMIEREAMIAENQRLLSELASSQRAPAEAEPEKPNFILPDLNEPLLGCLEPRRGS